MYHDRTFITSDDFDAAYRFSTFGLSVQPFSTTANESMLTVNGTEDNNGVKVQCIAFNATTLRRCPGRRVSVIFFQAGMIKLTFACIKLTFVCDELTCWCGCRVICVVTVMV